MFRITPGLAQEELRCVKGGEDILHKALEPQFNEKPRILGGVKRHAHFSCPGSLKYQDNKSTRLKSIEDICVESSKPTRKLQRGLVKTQVRLIVRHHMWHVNLMR